MPETYGPYVLNETPAAFGPWSVARATGPAGQAVRLSVLSLPAGLSDAGKARVASALERGVQARATAPTAPGVLAVLSGGEQNGALYLAESLANGPSVRELVAQHGPLAPETAITFLHGLAGSLDPLHAAGLAHGWLCPDNVYAENAAPVVGGQLWSSVLGMVRELCPSAAWPEAAYAAPETQAGAAADAHAEVYSAAALLLFAVTGQEAAAGPAALGLLPPALSKAVAKGLAATPDARYNGVKEMIVDVTVEQAIAMTDAADNSVVPEGGDVPDWANDLLTQTDIRRSSGRALVEAAAPAAAPAPAPAAIPLAAPAPAQPKMEATAKQVSVSPSKPAPSKEPNAGVPVFDWNKGQSTAKKSFVPMVVGGAVVLLVLLAIAFTVLHHHK